MGQQPWQSALSARDSNRPKMRMPPAGAALSPKQIALISVWIDAGAGTVGASVRVDYARDVEPILRMSCLGCHSGTEAKSQLRLDVKSEAMRVGPRGLIRGQNGRITVR